MGRNIEISLLLAFASAFLSESDAFFRGGQQYMRMGGHGGLDLPGNPMFNSRVRTENDIFGPGGLSGLAQELGMSRNRGRFRGFRPGRTAGEVRRFLGSNRNTAFKGKKGGDYAKFEQHERARANAMRDMFMAPRRFHPDGAPPFRKNFRPMGAPPFRKNFRPMGVPGFRKFYTPSKPRSRPVPNRSVVRNPEFPRFVGQQRLPRTYNQYGAFRAPGYEAQRRLQDQEYQYGPYRYGAQYRAVGKAGIGRQPFRGRPPLPVYDRRRPLRGFGRPGAWQTGYARPQTTGVGREPFLGRRIGYRGPPFPVYARRRPFRGFGRPGAWQTAYARPQTAGISREPFQGRRTGYRSPPLPVYARRRPLRGFGRPGAWQTGYARPQTTGISREPFLGRRTVYRGPPRPVYARRRPLRGFGRPGAEQTGYSRPQYFRQIINTGSQGRRPVNRVVLAPTSLETRAPMPNQIPKNTARRRQPFPVYVAGNGIQPLRSRLGYFPGTPTMSTRYYRGGKLLSTRSIGRGVRYRRSSIAQLRRRFMIARARMHGLEARIKRDKKAYVSSLKGRNKAAVISARAHYIRGYTYRTGTCKGHDIREIIGTTRFHCAGECTRRVKCKSFVWVDKGARSYCWLKDRACPKLTSTRVRTFHFYTKHEALARGARQRIRSRVVKGTPTIGVSVGAGAKKPTGATEVRTSAATGSQTMVTVLRTTDTTSGGFHIGGGFGRDMFNGTCPPGTKAKGKTRCEITNTQQFLPWLQIHAKDYGIHYSYSPLGVTK